MVASNPVQFTFDTFNSTISITPLILTRSLLPLVLLIYQFFGAGFSSGVLLSLVFLVLV
jgi:hypothetical protein